MRFYFARMFRHFLPADYFFASDGLYIRKKSISISKAFPFLKTQQSEIESVRIDETTGVVVAELKKPERSYEYITDPDDARQETRITNPRNYELNEKYTFRFFCRDTGALVRFLSIENIPYTLESVMPSTAEIYGNGAQKNSIKNVAVILLIGLFFAAAGIVAAILIMNSAGYTFAELFIFAPEAYFLQMFTLVGIYLIITAFLAFKQNR